MGEEVGEPGQVAGGWEADGAGEEDEGVGVGVGMRGVDDGVFVGRLF